MTLILFQNISKSQQLWTESSYLLRLRFVFEYRLGLAEIIRFSNNLNLTVDSSMTLKHQELNLEMVSLAKSLISDTFNNDIISSPFLFAVPVTDPIKGVVYRGAFPGAVNLITQLIASDSLTNQNTLRYNYESLHTNFTDFFTTRNTFYQQESSKQ